MEEAELLEALRRGSTDALEQIIARYGAYVFTVVRNRACGQLTQEDLEEIVSDVFVALWQRPDCVRTDCLKSWLGALARNKAVDRLRRITPLLPLDEDFLSQQPAVGDAGSAGASRACPRVAQVARRAGSGDLSPLLRPVREHRGDRQADRLERRCRQNTPLPRQAEAETILNRKGFER